jgi:hypothetical protein
MDIFQLENSIKDKINLEEDLSFAMIRDKYIE